MTIRPGEHVALVGENGSGKTTLVKLLCRLYDPSTGSISWDGTDLRSFDTTALRREISVVFQDYVRYHLPARENIWLGDVELPPDQRHIEEAARMADADDVIAKLPYGYDTILGKLFEAGEDLSVGEWQKIALARAVLRDAQIIVLDEPTSALDVVVQRQVFETLTRVQADLGAAVLLVGHDMGLMAQFVDRVGVLYAGKLVELSATIELFEEPLHPYATQLIESLPSLEEQGVFRGIRGLPPSLRLLPPGCVFHPRCDRAMPRCTTDIPELRRTQAGRMVACHLYDEGDE